MPSLESTGAHHPVFSHPSGAEPRPILLSSGRKLEHFTRLPLFAGILAQLFEKRPDISSDGKKTIRKVLVQDALLEHAELYEVPTGTLLFQEGSFGEHLFVLLKGQVHLSTHLSLDTERHAEIALEEIQPGDFFGETSVLSMNAHLSTAETTTPALLLLVPQFIVQELATTQGSFHKLIMQRYVERTVRTLVQRIPLLRFSTPEESARLIQKVQLKTFGAGEVIFEEGDPAATLYVIHQGFVKLSKQDQSKQKILSYLVEGDCFGETGVLTGAPRSATATAMSAVEALVIPGTDFKQLVDTDPVMLNEAQALANLQRLDADLAKDVTFIGARLEFQAEVMPNLDVLAIDGNTCIRCDNCVKACAAAHEDGLSRLIRKGVTFEEILLPTACRFCEDPVCLLCKSGGIKRDKDGDIYFTDSCIGCSGCAQRCPYGNIIMVDMDEVASPDRPTLGQYLLSKLAREPRETVASEKRPRIKKLPVKCDLDKDHLFPACVSNCPTGAIKRYRADELDLIIAGQR